MKAKNIILAPLQLLTLPVLALVDLVSKPTSRTLNERLENAVNNNLTLSAKYALHKGANASYKVCLMIAAETGNASLTRSLLEHGASPNQGYTRTLNNPYDSTTTVISGPALTFAIKQGHTAIVKTLLEHKANPWKEETTEVTTFGSPVVTKSSALKMAQDACYDDIEKLLLDAQKIFPAPAKAAAAPAPTEPAAVPDPAAPVFNATAAPNVTTDDDIVVTGPLKLKTPAPLQ